MKTTNLKAAPLVLALLGAGCRRRGRRSAAPRTAPARRRAGAHAPATVTSPATGTAWSCPTSR
jgi:hypothetical protein